MAEKLVMPWGKEQISFDLPEGWTVMGRFEPACLAPAAYPVNEVIRSLENPIGSPRLTELVKPGDKVTVVIDDGSRPTPVDLIFPLVQASLHECGIKDESITVVPAIGLHRHMTEVEIRHRLGISAEDNLHYVNPTCDDLESMVNLGTTSRGTPVWINRQVAEADLVISIGCIEPHIIASFGGGCKNILPGVAGRVSIAHNHTLNCAPTTFNMVGQPIEENPMRLDLEEGTAMLKPRLFIINAVLDNNQRLVQAVAGDAIQAHRAGVQVSTELYGCSCQGQADIVITDSHPMDSDLRQGVKALANTIRALKPGGVMITLIRAEEGVGVFGLANTKLPLGRSALKALAPVLIPLVPKLKIKGLGEEDRFFLYFALQAMRRGDLYFYAPTIPEETQSHLPFVRFLPSVEEILAAAKQKFPGKADVFVFPGGGITYPQRVD